MHLKRVVTPRLRRISELRGLATAAITASSREQDRMLLCVAVELANLWSEFCKSYVLSCAVGATSLSGARWVATLGPNGNAEDARIFLISAVGGTKPQNVNPRSDKQEPDWKNLQTVIQCCAALGLPNGSALTKAAGLGLNFLVELAAVRNFAAHRSHLARLKVDDIVLARGLGVSSDLSGVMLAPSSSGYGTIAIEWLSEVQKGIVTMCT